MRQFLTWCVLVMGVATAAAQGPSVQLNNTLDSNGLKILNVVDDVKKTLDSIGLKI